MSQSLFLDVLFVLNLFGFGLALLFAAGQLMHGKQFHRMILAAFFFTLGMIQLHDALFFFGRMEGLAHLLFTNIPFLFLAGPLLYAYLMVISNQDFQLRKRWLPHLAPGGIALLVLLPTFIQSESRKLELITRIHANQHPDGIFLLYVIALLAALGYATYLCVRLRRLFNRNTIREWKSLAPAMLVLSFFLVTLAGNIGFVSRDFGLLKFNNLVITLILIALFLLTQKNPRLLMQVAEELQRQRYSSSRLKGVDLTAVSVRLKLLLEVEKIHADESLTLSSLAARLNMDSHQLSEYLNAHLNKNFSTYINEYRVAAACVLLQADPRRTVLSVGLEVGFNSPSSFHDSFVKFTGKTPGEFRKQST